jgi:hypothetical protein
VEDRQTFLHRPRLDAAIRTRHADATIRQFFNLYEAHIGVTVIVTPDQSQTLAIGSVPLNDAVHGGSEQSRGHVLLLYVKDAY